MRKAAYTAPGKGTDSSTTCGACGGRRRQRQPAAACVDQRRRRGQRLASGSKVGWLCASDLGVAHELEARVDRLAQHVGQVVQVERGQVAGAVLHAQRAEGPGQRVAAVLVDVDVERSKRGPSGRKARRRCGAPASGRAPAGRRWPGRWWRGSGRTVRRSWSPVALRCFGGMASARADARRPGRRPTAVRSTSAAPGLPAPRRRRANAGSRSGRRWTGRAC
jgi:hypothetical protein